MDKIDAAEIQKNLTTDIIGKTIIKLESVGSTNTYASDIVNGLISIPEFPDYNGIVVISEIQTVGRGRLGRKWFSPSGGIWMTIILQPVLEIQDLSKITLIAATTIIETLRRNFKLKLNVKWPNDIYLEGKKLCGILAESEKINDTIYILLGIGINANNNYFNYDSENLNAVSLREITGQQINRNLFISEILNELEVQYIYFTETLDFKGIFKKIENIMIY